MKKNLIPKRKNGNKAKKDWSKTRLDHSRATPSSIVPCMSPGALDDITWAATALGSCSVLVLVPAGHIDFLLGEVYFMLVVFLRRHSPFLAPSVSRGLHRSLCFTFSASQNSLLMLPS